MKILSRIFIFRELFLEQQKRSWMEIYWTEKWWRILSIQQIQHILNFMRDDAIMLKCWTVNEYYGKFTSSCGVVAMITFHEFPLENLKAEQRKFSHFPVIFGTCVNGDSNFLTTGWILMIIRWRLNDTRCRDDNFPFSLTLDVFLFVFASLRFFMPIKYSQSDEMSHKSHLNWNLLWCRGWKIIAKMNLLIRSTDDDVIECFDFY